MVERIYDTIKGIIYTDFPKNAQGIPEVYDRQIEAWFFGDRQIYPSPLGIVLRGTTSNVKDIGFGLREIEYSIKITVFSSNDDQTTTERVVQEAARVTHSVLKNHRTMWVCDLCPFCQKLPLSPIHYIDNGVITNVGINTATLPTGITTAYIVSIPPTNLGYQGTAFVKVSPGISGKITVSEILSCGLGITETSYINPYVNLNFTISNGSGHTGVSTTVFDQYLSYIQSNVNTYWSETHETNSPPYYDWPGMAYQAVQMFISDWQAGIKPIGITSNTTWNTNLNSVVNNQANLMRLLQDIQVSAITPSDDGVEKAFLHTAEFTLTAREIISVDQFGPNNVNVNAV